MILTNNAPLPEREAGRFVVCGPLERDGYLTPTAIPDTRFTMSDQISTTDWTNDGRFRLQVTVLENAIVLTCETTYADFVKGEKRSILLGRIVILTQLTRPEAERFAEHAFGFYSPELGALAVAAVGKVWDRLKEPPAQSPASVPPRGAN